MRGCETKENNFLLLHALKLTLFLHSYNSSCLPASATCFKSNLNIVIALINQHTKWNITNAINGVFMSLLVLKLFCLLLKSGRDFCFIASSDRQKNRVVITREILTLVFSFIAESWLQ